MKKLVSAIICIMMVISIIQAPMAVNSGVQEKPNYRIYINSKLASLSSAPISVNNVILIESKDLLTMLGVQNYSKIFIWDKKKNNITVNAGKNIVINLTIGSKTAYKNKVKVQLSAAPVVYKNKVYLPVDSFAQFLNFKLAIDNVAKCVFIKSLSEYNKIKAILDSAQKNNTSAKNIQLKTRIFGYTDVTPGDLGIIIKYDRISNLMSLNYSVTAGGITANVEAYIINGMMYSKEHSFFRSDEDEDNSNSWDEEEDNSNSWDEDEDNSNSWEDEDNSNSWDEDEDNSNSWDEDEDNSNSWDEDEEDSNGWEKTNISDADMNSSIKTIYFPLTELIYCSMSIIKDNNDEIVLSGPCWGDKNVLDYNLNSIKMLDEVNLNTVITINKKGNYISKVIMKSNNTGEDDNNLELDIEYTLNSITIDIPAELKEK